MQLHVLQVYGYWGYEIGAKCIIGMWVTGHFAQWTFRPTDVSPKRWTIRPHGSVICINGN